jgi:hypothetical protein
MSRVTLAAVALAVAQTAACAIPSVPAKLPPPDHAWIAVLSGELPEAIEQVARHAWIVGNLPGETPVRWELMGSAYRSQTRDPFSYFGDGDVAVHGIVLGSVAEIRRLHTCLDAEVQRYGQRHPTYWPIPGPNSNTFVAESLRHCGIHVELPSTAIGRDYRGLIGAGVTESGTGVQLESWLVGARIGLREGVEAHVTGLALGVHAWPPGITVPVNPGRIGIDLDGHVAPNEKRTWLYDERSYESDRERDYGVAVAQMFAGVARVKRPEDAGGLAERATVGLSGHAIYTKKHLGYAIGTDFELGMGIPAGFAYGIHVYPAGIGWVVGPTGYVAVFGGAGVSGVTARVPGGLELPIEARAELDAGPRARLGLRATTVWVPGVEARRGGSMLPFADELVLGSFVRFGRTRTSSMGTMGRGHFFGLERHEVMHTYWLGLTYGVEADFGL